MGDHMDEINNLYEDLSLQIERALVAGDPILMVDDLNAKLGNHESDVHDMSSNGQNCKI